MVLLFLSKGHLAFVYSRKMPVGRMIKARIIINWIQTLSITTSFTMDCIFKTYYSAGCKDDYTVCFNLLIKGVYS